MRGHHGHRLLAGEDGDYFEGRAGAAPGEDPLLQQPQIIARHHLEAPTEVGANPAVNVREALGKHPPALPHALVDRHHVVVPEPFDDHEQHAASLRAKHARTFPPAPERARALVRNLRSRAPRVAANGHSWRTPSILLFTSRLDAPRL